jgi:hypothetical protein
MSSSILEALGRSPIRGRSAWVAPPALRLVRQLRGPQVSTCAWWSRRSRKAATAAGPPISLPQSSTWAVRRDERRRPLIPAHDDLEEIIGRGLRQFPHRQVIDDEQGDRRDVGEVGLAGAAERSVGQFVEEDMRLAIEDAMALLDDGDADGLRQVALARAGRHSHILRSFSVQSSSTMPGTPSSASA